MKYIYFALLTLAAPAFASHDPNDPSRGHWHEGRLHETAVDGTQLRIDPKRLRKFVKGLEEAKLAIVDVKGMVCDFCARGIEKTFKRDKSVLKVDVDLDHGKVLIAYRRAKDIDFADIKKKITANGQSATDLQILDI